MGKFGIIFNDENGYPFYTYKRRQYATITVFDEEKTGNGRFDRFLAWLSYFILVFSSVSVFSPPALASMLVNVGIAHEIQHELPLLPETPDILRGTIGLN